MAAFATARGAGEPRAEAAPLRYARAAAGAPLTVLRAALYLAGLAAFLAYASLALRGGTACSRLSGGGGGGGGDAALGFGAGGVRAAAAALRLFSRDAAAARAALADIGLPALAAGARLPPGCGADAVLDADAAVLRGRALLAATAAAVALAAFVVKPIERVAARAALKAALTAMRDADAPALARAARGAPRAAGKKVD